MVANGKADVAALVARTRWVSRGNTSKCIAKDGPLPAGWTEAWADERRAGPGRAWRVRRPDPADDSRDSADHGSDRVQLRHRRRVHRRLLAHRVRRVLGYRLVRPPQGQGPDHDSPDHAAGGDAVTARRRRALAGLGLIGAIWFATL